jgi:hypothetical protein
MEFRSCAVLPPQPVGPGGPVEDDGDAHHVAALPIAVATCGRRRSVMAHDVVNRFAVRGLGVTVPIRSALLETCEPSCRGCWSCRDVVALPF